MSAWLLFTPLFLLLDLSPFSDDSIDEEDDDIIKLVLNDWTSRGPIICFYFLLFQFISEILFCNHVDGANFSTIEDTIAVFTALNHLSVDL